MNKIVFQKNANGVGGEFVELEDRFLQEAQVKIQDVRILGEVQKIGKRFYMHEARSIKDWSFEHQEAAIQFGFIYFKEQLKKQYTIIKNIKNLNDAQEEKNNIAH